jgi:hypothetical protein
MCRRLYGCNKIHGHNTNISIVGQIKAQNVNYYCNSPKDGPLNGLKHLFWCIWNLRMLDKKKVSIRTFPVLSSYNLDFLISLHTSELNNNFYALYIFIPIAYLHFCYWFVISKKNVTCYNQMIVAIVDVLRSLNFFPHSIQSVIFFSTFLLLRC